MPAASRSAARQRTLASPQDAQAQGIATIYQELNLLPNLTVAENVFIGREPGGRGVPQLAAAWPKPRARLLARIGLAHRPVDAGQRALGRRAADGRDRPRAVDRGAGDHHGRADLGALGGRGRAPVRDRARACARRGSASSSSPIGSTRCCRSATARRCCATAGWSARRDVAEVTVDDLIRMMVGRSAARAVHAAARARGRRGVLEVAGHRRGAATRSTRTRRVLDRVEPESCAAARSSGIAGLMGSGRTELARAIFGADRHRARPRSGSTAARSRIRSPEDAIRAGIGLVPEDRKQQALFLALAVRTNLSLAALGRLVRASAVVDERAEAALVERYRASPQHPHGEPGPAGRQSFGRQSAEGRAGALAGARAQDPDRRRADPRHRRRRQGRGPPAARPDGARAASRSSRSSSELPEILAIADRIVTMREGRITGEIAAQPTASEERLMQMMTLAPGRIARHEPDARARAAGQGLRCCCSSSAASRR